MSITASIDDKIGMAQHHIFMAKAWIESFECELKELTQGIEHNFSVDKIKILCENIQREQENIERFEMTIKTFEDIKKG